MKILLTGGCGFIGSHLADAFLEKGHEVVVVDNFSHNNPEGVNKKAKLYKINIIDSLSLEKIFDKERPQVVNHHAAVASVSSLGIDIFKTNVIGTLNLLILSKKYQLKKFIFSSSAAVYGQAKKFPIKENNDLVPTSEYGISKLIAEYYIKLFVNCFNTIIFRYSNVFGPRQDATGEGGVIAIFIKKILSEKKCLIFGDGKQTRDFIYIKDIVKANLQALNYKNNAIFNIASGHKITITQLYNRLFKLLEPLIKSKKNCDFISERIGEIKESVLDNSLVRKNFSWQPEYDFLEGIKETTNYFRKDSFKNIFLK